MATSPEFPIERRRRHNSSHSLEPTQLATVPPMRRESDVVKARLQRWIELADRALGIAKPKSRNGHNGHNGNGHNGHSGNGHNGHSKP